jgi:hypothetical protein
VVWWSPYSEPDKTLEKICRSTTCDRDAVLCPTHAHELEPMLKDIGRWAARPASGTA